MGYVCALAYMQGGFWLLFPTNLPSTLLLVAQATDMVANEFFLDEINVIYTTPVRHLVRCHLEPLRSILISGNYTDSCVLRHVAFDLITG